MEIQVGLISFISGFSFQILITMLSYTFNFSHT